MVMWFMFFFVVLRYAKRGIVFDHVFAWEPKTKATSFRAVPDAMLPALHFYPDPVSTLLPAITCGPELPRTSIVRASTWERLLLVRDANAWVCSQETTAPLLFVVPPCSC
jgi:hypothetical protein